MNRLFLPVLLLCGVSLINARHNRFDDLRSMLDRMEQMEQNFLNGFDAIETELAHARKSADTQMTWQSSEQDDKWVVTAQIPAGVEPKVEIEGNALRVSFSAESKKEEKNAQSYSAQTGSFYMTLPANVETTKILAEQAGTTLTITVPKKANKQVVVKKTPAKKITVTAKGAADTQKDK